MAARDKWQKPTFYVGIALLGILSVILLLTNWRWLAIPITLAIWTISLANWSKGDKAAGFLFLTIGGGFLFLYSLELLGVE